MIGCDERTKQIDESILSDKLVGRTIKKIDNSACNVLGIEFEDGYCVNVTYEYICDGLYGIVCGERGE